MKVYLRGNPATQGDEVAAPVPRHPFRQNRPLFTQGSGRLELARSHRQQGQPADGPGDGQPRLDALFRQGHRGDAEQLRPPRRTADPSRIARSPGRPFHGDGGTPLVVLKKLHREIMLSAVYQAEQPVRCRPIDQSDPGNHLLGRMQRRRLEVEPWRDALLAVAGNLDRTMGGPSVNLASPDNRRRTLYAAISRHNLDGLLRLFDFPDPNITADRRPVTTVPLQQLFVLNSEFMVRQAKALAARLHENKDEDDAARIRRAFVLVYGRPARDAEIQLGLEFLKAAGRVPRS